MTGYQLKTPTLVLSSFRRGSSTPSGRRGVHQKQ